MRGFSFSCLVAVCCLLCASCASLAAEDSGKIRSATLESQTGYGGSYTITVLSDGTVLYADADALQQIMGKSQPGRRGRIARSQASKLFALIEKDYAGGKKTPYSAKRTVSGVEPKVRLVLTFTDGSILKNLGPGDMADPADIRHFRDIEAGFVNAATAVGAKDLLRFYGDRP